MNICNDNLKQIFSYLYYDDLWQSKQVCKLWHKLIISDNLKPINWQLPYCKHIMYGTLKHYNEIDEYGNKILYGIESIICVNCGINRNICDECNYVGCCLQDYCDKCVYNQKKCKIYFNHMIKSELNDIKKDLIIQKINATYFLIEECSYFYNLFKHKFKKLIDKKPQIYCFTYCSQCKINMININYHYMRCLKCLNNNYIKKIKYDDFLMM
jgi:hypothetical protein